jgi:hypothetical protein
MQCPENPGNTIRILRPTPLGFYIQHQFLLLLLLQVARGSAVPLPHLSLLEVCGEPLLFMVNGLAVQRAVARSSALVM